MINLADWEVTRKQKKLVKQVLKSGRLTYGPKTRLLEHLFALIHGVDYALFTSSGTDALKIALGGLKEKYGWKDGDEVIIPAVTFVATMNAILMNNLRPVLVDVDISTVSVDPSQIEKAITKRTRAIMPVHLFGQSSDMQSIMRIAKRYKLKVVEDSCETMFVNKVKGDIACFSTYITHLLVTGVGGFITTNDKKLATLMRSIMFHGRDESYLSIDDRPEDISKRFWFPRFGYSDRATELEAALGLGDLDNWQDMIQKRQANARYLMNELKDYWQPPNISFPVTDVENHAFMFFPMLVQNRDKLMLYLEGRGIETRTMMPLTNQPITKPYLKKKYPNAEYVNQHGLLIACHQHLTKKDLAYIVESVEGFYS